MRALVIGTAELRMVESLIAKAAADVVPLAVMKRLVGQTRTPEIATMNDDKTIAIPVGYLATYTHEEHAPGLVLRHLRVSVDASGKGPSPEAFAALMGLFDFVNGFDEVPKWLQQLDGEAFAVNAVEPLSGDMAEIERKR